jgi:hypothetical protein
MCLFSATRLACSKGGTVAAMKVEELLKSVRNDRIQFATARRPGTRFAVLDRRVIITNPPELLELLKRNDVTVLEQLTRLLIDPSRAWAAEVLLAALTGREEDLVDSFAGDPQKWWDAIGHTAHERWSAWLSHASGRLVWDPKEKLFVEK